MKLPAPILRFDPALLRLLRESLKEDAASGDITSMSIVPRSLQGEGRIIAKASGIFCGAPVAERIWGFASPRVQVGWRVAEGQAVRPGQMVAELRGPYRALLLGERVALNFMQRLSGIATLTRKMVEGAKTGGGHAPPKICDTRKTTPLWRKLERYAVRMGGGINHRFGLFDMVLIKENHVRAAGDLREAIQRAKAGINRREAPKIAAEATNRDEVRQALNERADLILLDNMPPARVKRIVHEFRAEGIPFEVSGGVSLKNIGAYAATGVDRISIGALTHSAPALDLSLQLEPARSGGWSESKVSRS